MNAKANAKRITNNSDFISTLPNHILCHILSFIPTKYSVRSSALSTRWKYLFTLVPVLKFDHTEVRGICGSFVSFVYNVLLTYDVPNLQEFLLNIEAQKIPPYDIYSWISAAFRRNVRNVCLTSYVSSWVRLPHCICTSKILVTLKVSGNFFLKLDGSMFMPSLKTLHLENGILNMGESKQLSFSTCPVLEEFVLDCKLNCKHPNVIVDISVSSLKRLILLLRDNRCSFVLNTPALQFLNYHSHELIKISGNVWKSLSEAHICVCKPWEDLCVIQKLFSMALNVHTLRLCSRSIEAIALGHYELPRYQNLTRLELKTEQSFGWRSLPTLLEISPNLEILIFICGLMPDGNEYIEINHVPLIRELACLSLHLKEIEIRIFYGAEIEFLIVGHFLKNAKVLKKMNVCLMESLQSRYAICQRLLSIPRYSRDCQVVVLDKKFSKDG